MSVSRFIPVALLPFSLALGQFPTPATHKAFAAGTHWVNGIAEPASGRFIVYAQDDSTITIHNRSTQRRFTIRNVIDPSDNNSVNISRSGNLLAFVRGGEGGTGPFVWTQSLDTLSGEPIGAPRRVTLVKSRVAQPSSDGRWIAFIADDANLNDVSGGTRLLVIPSVGGTPRMLDSAARGLGSPRWSPDDQWIYYERRPALVRIRVNGGSPDSIGTTGRLIDVSPDGSHLAFYNGPQNWNVGPHTIDISRPDGRIVARLDSDVWSNRAMAWSANGQSLLAVQSFEPSRIGLLRIDDGALTQFPLTRDRDATLEELEAFGYSKDGGQLLVIGAASGRKVASVYQVATGQRRDYPLATNTSRIRWAPNGKHLSFLHPRISDRGAEHRLMVLDLASGRSSEIGNLGQQERYRWLSNSSAIDFVKRIPQRTGQPLAELRRATIGGSEQLLRQLDVDSTMTVFWLLNDSIVARGTGPVGELRTINKRTGAERVAYKGAFARGSGSRNVLLSPDGKWIVFGVDAGVEWKGQLMLASIDGSQQRRIGSVGCGPSPSDWDRQTNLIFTYNWDCDRDVELVGLTATDGSPTRFFKVAPNPYSEIGPVELMPDGKGVLVTQFQPQDVSVTTIDIGRFLKGGGR